MPELPEVETVARDLRPRILGATITGARVSWARTLRTHTPEAFGEAIAGRRVEAVFCYPPRNALSTRSQITCSNVRCTSCTRAVDSEGTFT